VRRWKLEIDSTYGPDGSVVDSSSRPEPLDEAQWLMAYTDVIPGSVGESALIAICHANGVDWADDLQTTAGIGVRVE
jgi:hypothetical protein